MSKAISILVAFLIAISFGAGYYLGYKGKELPTIKPIVKYIPIEIPKTVTVDRPVKEYIYQTVEKVRIDTVYVPVEMKDYVISDRHPLVVNPSSVTFRYFDTNERRYQEDVYSVPDRLVRFSLTTGVGVDAISLFEGNHISEVTPDINVRANLNFGRIGTYGSVNTKVLNKDWQVRVGVSYTLLSR